MTYVFTGIGTGKYIKPGDPTNVYEEFKVRISTFLVCSGLYFA